MNNCPHVFTPLKIGKVTVKNRIEMAPVMPFLATIDGDASPELIEWESAFARGGAGIVTIGDSPIMSKTATKVGHILNLGIDKSVTALNRLAETIQRYGAKASIEMTYFDPADSGSPTDLSVKEINMVINSYARAAERCLKGGLDMIMVHGGHGHLISQFLSTKKNLRTDAYGGEFKNRARFATEVLEAIRDRIGDRLAIEYRISADELVAGGLTVKEQLAFAKLIQDKIDLIHVSVGNLFEPECSPMMIQPAYVPRGINVRFAELFKKELKIPVTALGSLNMELAEQIIAEDRADMVAMARTLIADPDCVNKAKKGEANNIRPCVRCNSCIERTHRFFWPVRCTVNPLSGREAEFRHLPAPTRKKKVVVIGGGPAGMEAARAAAGRGHEVVLFEKEAKLGGALIAGSVAPFKADMKAYLDWAARTTMNTPNLAVKLSTEASQECIRAEKPDAIIIGVGSLPIVPGIPGVDRKNVVLAADVYLGRGEIGDKVLVAGAGLTGSEIALYLAQQGKQVTLVDMLSSEQIEDNSPLASVRIVWDMLIKFNVEIKTEVKLETINDHGAVILHINGNRSEIPCDTIVIALGIKPRTESFEKFSGLAPSIYIVGDCNNRRGNLYHAVSEGFLAAMEI